MNTSTCFCYWTTCNRRLFSNRTGWTVASHTQKGGRRAQSGRRALPSELHLRCQRGRSHTLPPSKWKPSFKGIRTGRAKMAPSQWDAKHWRQTAARTLTSGARSRPGPWIVSCTLWGLIPAGSTRPWGAGGERLDSLWRNREPELGISYLYLPAAPAPIAIWERRLAGLLRQLCGGAGLPGAAGPRAASWACSPPGTPTLSSRWGTDQASSVHLLTQAKGTWVKTKIALRSCKRIRN